MDHQSFNWTFIQEFFYFCIYLVYSLFLLYNYIEELFFQELFNDDIRNINHREFNYKMAIRVYILMIHLGDYMNAHFLFLFLSILILILIVFFYWLFPSYWHPFLFIKWLISLFKSVNPIFNVNINKLYLNFFLNMIIIC